MRVAIVQGGEDVLLVFGGWGLRLSEGKEFGGDVDCWARVDTQ